jgi:hypothetical protein
MRIAERASVPLRRRPAALALAAVLTLGAPLAGAQAGQTAAWTQQKFTFVTLGSQTRYTCYGLRSYIERILLGLGARKEDLNVHEVSCSRGHPPSVAASFWMLEPVPGAHMNAVPAHWENVQITFAGGTGTGPDLGGCELAHQAMAQILPYFLARNAAFDPDCTENVPGGPPYAVHADVLKPDNLR